MPQPGEPLFTDEDTAYAIALAEEEAATCPSCGLLKVVCRDPAYQFGFEAQQEQCHATYALAALRHSPDWEAKQPATRDATQVTAKFRPDAKQPPIDVGLGLAESGDDAADQTENDQPE